jgi:hypothetical protein
MPGLVAGDPEPGEGAGALRWYDGLLPKDLPPPMREAASTVSLTMKTAHTRTTRLSMTM